jgi:peptidoglycan/LPS O-acetylase OafA/YrhL
MSHFFTSTNRNQLSSDSGEMTPKVSAPKIELKEACPMQTHKKSRYVPELDGIRTVAIFSVLMHHGFSNRCPGGFLGVDLFFVLSGYLITRLLVAEFDTKSTINLSVFYIRRACRLMPAIFTTIIFAVLLRKITANNPNTLSDFQCAKSILLYYSNFLYGSIGNLNHTWSLSIEQQFYLIWPAILLISFRFISLSALLTTLSLTIMGCVALRCELMLEHFQGFSLYTFTPTRIDTILVGTLIGLTSELPASDVIIKFLRKIYAPEIVMAIFLYLYLSQSQMIHGFTSEASPSSRFYLQSPLPATQKIDPKPH